MKPSDFQGIILKQIRLALPVRAKGAEYAIADILDFCRELNRNRFYFIPLRELISYFHMCSSRRDREQASTKVKIEGLNMLLEAQLIKKTSRYRLRFTMDLKLSLAAQYLQPARPKKIESSEESNIMAATTSG